MVEPTTLQMLVTTAPLLMASRTAARVSAVSPDWLMASHHRLGLDYRVAVAELGGLLDVGRDARQVLEIVFAHHAGVEAGAAGGDDYAVDLGHLARREVEPLEARGGGGLVEASAQGVGEGVGLLEDLLEHEVLETALFGGGGVPVDVGCLAGDGDVVYVADVDGVGLEEGQVVVV
jgi:hypothetical protein